jgi:hypothetical protein
LTPLALCYRIFDRGNPGGEEAPQFIHKVYQNFVIVGIPLGQSSNASMEKPKLVVAQERRRIGQGMPCKQRRRQLQRIALEIMTVDDVVKNVEDGFKVVHVVVMAEEGGSIEDLRRLIGSCSLTKMNKCSSGDVWLRTVLESPSVPCFAMRSAIFLARSQSIITAHTADKS